MIESIHFHNFKALRDTTLPLGRCTILVGPNGSGKSTVLQAIELTTSTSRDDRDQEQLRQCWSLHADSTDERGLEIRYRFGQAGEYFLRFQTQRAGLKLSASASTSSAVARMRVYSFAPDAIAASSAVSPAVELSRDGRCLASVLDNLRDTVPDRFDALNQTVGEWLPEFERIQFSVPTGGQKVIALATCEGGHRIPAKDLSQGTLIALALLTLAYLPEPPSLVALEEPDRGIHPRLLRRVQDALYRLAYPESFGEQREPVQVLATTHSPYFLDLFKDHPEEIVIANKVGLDVRFERLSERKDIEEILGAAPLGEAWYSGVLGGVPNEP